MKYQVTAIALDPVTRQIKPYTGPDKAFDGYGRMEIIDTDTSHFFSECVSPRDVEFAGYWNDIVENPDSIVKVIDVRSLPNFAGHTVPFNAVP